MIPKECKRLAEVDFPIAVVSKHAAREKSIRHGHPSTLHLWWARRPLASCRAMLLALLLPDPCDPACPPEFQVKARQALQEILGIENSNEGLRKALFTFVGDVANWDVAAHSRWLSVARELVKAAHGDDPPLVVDPFAGGGSIPLEALRLGCDAFASDLNPVACLILKTMLEDIPRHGPELAEELRRVGTEIKKAAEKELSEFYPPYRDGAKPIAYLWARTLRCESTGCGAEIPLIRSFWLCKKADRKRALRYKVVHPKGATPRVEFEIFEPKSDKEVPAGTVARAKAACSCCNIVLSPDRVRAQLREQRGGADVIFDRNGQRIGGARLLTVVTLHPGEQGRQYQLPSEGDYEAVYNAQKILEKIKRTKLLSGLSPFPDEPLPPHNTNCFRIPNYGMGKWTDISTARQKLALATFAKHVRDLSSSEEPYRVSMKEVLAITVSRCSDFNSSLNSWASGGEFVRSTFARQALSMVWDFCETMPLTTESGGLEGAVNWVIRVIEGLSVLKGKSGQVQVADACASPLPDDSVAVWFTDPPYYDAVGYAELSDFFFVWLKRGLPGHSLLRDPFDPNNPLVHKMREGIQDENYQSADGTPKDKDFFEKTMARAFNEGRRVIKNDGIGCVVFAHKTTEGWEALLSGMISGGWVITGSWPIATERPGRLRSQESAALSASVHLVCRPRPDDAPVGEWADVFRELPNRIGNWMERLSAEGVRGADLVFACIGPAMEVYSRYSRVEDAEGREIPLGGDPTAAEPYKRGFLAYVWETAGRTALGQILGTAEALARNGVAGALEEDARLTALFLWTLQATDIEVTKTKGEEADEEADADDDEQAVDKGAKRKGFTLIYDVARRFAQPLGIHLDQWEGRIIETEKGIVRLLPIAERAKQLFGEDGASAVADRIEANPTGPLQMGLFSTETPDIKGHGHGKKSKGTRASEGSDDKLATHHDVTTLDRVHAAMLLQASGRTNALRALLRAEEERGQDFFRLANALSALYPKESEEKRLLDAMIQTVFRQKR